MKSDKFLLLLLALAVEVLLLTLADWQYARMQYKQALAAAGAARPQTTLRGAWDDSRTVALDNQPSPRGDAVGRRVLTPLATPSGTVIVDRGWLPLGRDTAAPPDFAALAPTADAVSGRMEPFPRRHGWLPGPDVTTTPRVLTFLNPALITSDTLGATYLIATTSTSPNLRASPPPAPDADMHAGYALQWLLMALAFPLCCLAAWRRKR